MKPMVMGVRQIRQAYSGDEKMWLSATPLESGHLKMNLIYKRVTALRSPSIAGMTAERSHFYSQVQPCPMPTPAKSNVSSWHRRICRTPVKGGKVRIDDC